MLYVSDEDIKCTGPNIGPLETPLVTGCHLDIEPLTTALCMHLQHLTHFSEFNQKLDGKNAGGVSCAWEGLV